MGRLVDILAGLAKALRRPVTETDQRYVGATVRTGEEVSGKYDTLNQRDAVRVGRASVGTIAVACNLLANACARGELKLYRKARTSKASKSMGQDDESEEVLVHPVLDLLKDPDPSMTSAEWFKLLYWYREAAGIAYIWTGGDTPTGLYLLAPQYTRPVLDHREGVTHYRYGRENSRPLEVPASQVVVTRYKPDPMNPMLASTWQDAVWHYADMESAAVTSELARWKNGGQYGMILGVPKESTDDYVKQVTMAVRQKGGPTNAGSALVLREPTVIQANSKPHEMNYAAGLERAEKAIYDAAGVPESVWRMNDANRASATTGNAEWGRVVYERQCAVASDLTEWLLPMFKVKPGEMWFEYENPVTEDVTAAATRMIGAFTAGCVTVNEVRAVLGLDPVDDSSNTMGRPAPMFPTAPMQEEEDDEDETEDQQTPASGDNPDATGGDGPGGGGDGSSPEGGDDESEPEDQGDAAKARGKGAKPQLVGRWEWTGKCGCGKRHARKADPTDESIEARIFRAVRSWAEDALKRGVSAIGPDGSFDISALSSTELEGLLKTSISEAFRAGAVSMTAQYAPDAEPLTSEAARQYIADYNFDLVKGVTETMADQMRTTIDAGLEQGKTINEIQQELTDKIPEVSLNRAEVIARTETSRAYQHGSLKQAEELGFDSKEWLLSGNPCGLCEGADRALSGKMVPIKEPFFKAGDTIAGTDGKVYVMARPVMAASDIHPSCGCVGIPMVTEDEQ